MLVLLGVALSLLFALVKLPYRAERQIANSIGMKLVRIPAGEFMMGGQEPAEQLAGAFEAYHRKPDYFNDEYPRHRVRITRSFLLGQFEVTVGQFRQFVQATGYRTEAEEDGTGGWGYDAAIRKCDGRKPLYPTFRTSPAAFLCNIVLRVETVPGGRVW